MRHETRPSPTHLAMALAAALMTVAIPAAAKSPAGAKPMAKPTVQTMLEFVGSEDQALEINLGAKPGAVMVPPKHGNLLLDRTPMVYVPHTDFNGTDVFLLEMDGLKREVAVRIGAVNDAPSFKADLELGHLADGQSEVAVAGWAHSISAGAPDEQDTQKIRFEIDPALSINPSVSAIAIDGNGTLHYTLTGQPGVSEYHVRAVDDGGTANGGIDHSEARVLRIGVDAVADLSVQFLPDADAEAPGLYDYQVVVGNKGPGDAQGVRVTEILPPGAGKTTWRCSGSNGGSCPKFDHGDGAIDIQVDLPANGIVVFSVRGMQSRPGSGLHAAFVEPPKHVVDPDLSNNEFVD